METKQMISVSPKAFDEIVRLNTEGKPLRIAVTGGGCSGLSYKLSFEDAREGDKILECQNVVIVIDPKSALYIKGMTLDFSDGLDGRGFVFNNPQSKQSCGCGSSFSV
jgi:iron-sulfur cluster assembly protein